MPDKSKNNSPGDSYRPDWAPAEDNDGFAVRIVKGKRTESGYRAAPFGGKKKISKEDYVKGVREGDRNILAKTITLVESNSKQHFLTAREVLKDLLPYSGNSLRIGITGVPGAGKSTLIEALGMYLVKNGHKVAVLTVDPSSAVSGGSILGDKTRMENLSREPNCFIRPSPSGGTLGGVTRKSRETMLVCEAAGYDVILIETVGVGQSEVTVRSMVDFFALVLIAGAGDELQGIKKGIMELADAIVINKADGDNKSRAEIARAEYSNALHYLKPATKGWETRALAASALTGEGIEKIWQTVKKFESVTNESGEFVKRRKDQSLNWVFSLVEESLKDDFYNSPEVKSNIPGIKEKVTGEEMLPTAAAELLLSLYRERK